MFGKKSSEVLVVGAGPVGLFAALALAERGARVQILEEQYRSTTRSYALALHPATLDRLAQVGLAEQLTRAGLRLDTLAFYDAARRLGELHYGALESTHPYLLILPQSVLEEALIGRVAALGVEVSWNHRLAALAPEADFVAVTAEKLTKESVGYATAHTEWAVEREEKIRAGYVIGADGHASRVRRQLGLPFASVGPEQYYAIFELTAAGARIDEARIVLGDRMSVLWPLGDGRYRWSFEVSESEAQAAEREKSRVVPVPGYGSFGHLDRGMLTRLLEERAPWFEPRVIDLTWSVALRFERRLVPELGRGRVWLAGDAAHLAAPIGVQSMNLGLQEAHDLCARIHAVLRKGAPVDSLRLHAQEWLPRLQAHLGASALTADAGAPEWARRYAPMLRPLVPASGEHLARLVEQIGLRALA